MNRNTHPNPRNSNFFALAILLLGLLLMVGCQSGKPASASFASVTIPGKTPQEICNAAATVFQENGYQVASLNPSAMVFQKEASRMKSMAYNGVVNTHYGAVTLERVKAELVDLGAGSFRLQCQASIVRGAGDSFFEDESRLSNLRSGPYQSLLNKVAKRLK
jgi:hypothetical protein